MVRLNPAATLETALRLCGRRDRLEQREVDRLAHRLVPGVAWVQVIAGVERRAEGAGLRRIARGRVEVDHAVVGLARADPLVDGLTLGLADRGEVHRAFERRQRRA